MGEPLVQVTPKLAMPRSRYLEWLQGTRPPPGSPDAWEFYRSGIGCGLYTEAEAAALLARHRELEAAEAAESGPEIPAAVRDWLTARGWQPPPGL